MATNEIPLELPNWHTDIIDSSDLTMSEFLVRESIRCKEWADWYWSAIDGDNSLDTTERLIILYEEVCDWIDQLEADPEFMFSHCAKD